MNRIVLIGNGFDLAHKLPTRYEDFINWYWSQRIRSFFDNNSNISDDPLATFEIGHPHTWSEFATQLHQKLSAKDIIQLIRYDYSQFGRKISPFWKNICNSVETKGWVDIENEYYNLLTKYSIEEVSQCELKKLNEQLQFIKEKLIQYLTWLNAYKPNRINEIGDIIYSPIKSQDISVEGGHFMQEQINYWMEQGENVLKEKMRRYGISDSVMELADIEYYKNNDKICSESPTLFTLPENILLLNFNYTYTAKLYIKQVSQNIQIHGELNKPKNIIFGYGDEMDDNYKTLQKLNDNECLQNIKSIKYMEADCYRKVLGFVESAPFQIIIMGHSCGNSDRTLLNTLFEHKNCISIKPYYYKKEDGTDNYLELVMNISRNFTDMKLMRDRVVNKTYCEPLPG